MFGERLRNLREHQEMSQLEVAKKLDIMQIHIAVMSVE